MRIAIASDHAGFRYKTIVAEHLRQRGHEVVDFGTDSEEPVDYPDFVRPAALAVARGECERGVIFGGSGNGEAMTANRIPGVRCAVAWSEESARFARAHNDANMISQGQRLISEQQALANVDVWLVTPFDGGRHAARIAKLDPKRVIDLWNAEELQSIPGVGPSIAEDLAELGYSGVSQLCGADPQQMYQELCALRGKHIDRCVLYVFREAVYYASNSVYDPELLKWWNWKDGGAHET